MTMRTQWTLEPLRWTRESAKLTGTLALVSVSLVISYRACTICLRHHQSKHGASTEVVELLTKNFGSNTVIVNSALFPGGEDQGYRVTTFEIMAVGYSKNW